MKRLLLPIFLRFAKLLGIDEIQRRLDNLDTLIPQISESRTLASDAFTVAQFSEQRSNIYTDSEVERLRTQLRGIQDQIGRDQQQVVFHVDQRQIQIDQQVQNFIIEFENIQQSLQSQLSQFRLDLNTVRRSTEFKPESNQLRSGEVEISQSNQNTIDDILYVALEDAFRGDRDLVAQRQSEYIPLLGNKIDTDHPLIDLGCGRGEWLTMLKERGIPARGIDGNSACVAECVELDLDVQKGDLIAFLKQCEDDSFGAVTLFQVFEHLPFPVLVDCLQEIQRVLVSGGILIAEIPNAKNVRVGSGTFWIDPTHQRPLFPEVLQFLATYVGFTSVDGKYTNRLGPVHDLAGLTGGAKAALESAMEALDGPGDFALIASA